MNLWVVLLTGLTVGGLTCLAVQGGLLASVIAAKEEEEVEKQVNTKNPLIPTLAFLVAKFASHVALGFILGAFGGAISINQTAQIMMQLAAGVYMIAVALNLLNIHPMFRYVVIQPPKFLLKRIKNQSRSKQLFAPALLGVMTIFIPCGTTLAMEAMAIASANALTGAAIMGVFILGTMPLFFGVGVATSLLGDNFRDKFLKLAAVAIIFLGVTSVNGALIALGFPLNSETITEVIKNDYLARSKEDVDNIETTQNPEIVVTSSGYSPRYIKVKKGSPVTVKVVAKDAYGCASAFRVPALGVSKNLLVNETYTFTFTPDSPGKIRFACSMGMFTGVIEVI